MPESETRKKVSHRTAWQALHCASSGSAEPVAASSLQGGWSDKRSIPLCAGEAACRSQVSGKERGGLRILSGIVSSVCREYGLQQITSLTSTEKARRVMFADSISNSWRAILTFPPSLVFQNLFVCYSRIVDSPYSVSAYLPEIVLRI